MLRAAFHRFPPRLQRLVRAARRAGRWVRCVGRRYYCPCCGRTARRFQAFGRTPRPDARCPWCDSLERHRLLWLTLRPRLNDVGSRNVRVLHVAPEQVIGKLLREAPGVEYVSLDLQWEARVHGDIAAMPFRDEAFDLIICSHVLEHVDDDIAAMKEMVRVLSRGGVAMVLVPFADSPVTDEDPTADADERIARFGQADHVRLYGRDVLDRLRGAGFEVEVVGPPSEEKMRLLPSERVFVCR